MPTIKRFEDILAWQKARELVNRVYRHSECGPFKRDFTLKDQMRRAAIGSMSNIAEGFGRRTDNDFAHFLDIAKGSALEVQSLLYVAVDQKYITDGDFRQLYSLADETVRLIVGFNAYLRT